MEPKKLISYLTGAVVQFFVKDGATVRKGQRICGIEMMKMINEICAPTEGRVEFHCRLGQVVKKGDLLVSIHPISQEADDAERRN